MRLNKDECKEEEINMNIEIYAEGFTADTETRHFARSCADFELGTFVSQIAFVRIFLTGPREAADDKHRSCQVEVIFDGGEVASSRAVDNDLHIAIYWALERAGGTVAQRRQHASWPADPVSSGDLLPPEQRADPYLGPDLAA